MSYKISLIIFRMALVCLSYRFSHYYPFLLYPFWWHLLKSPITVTCATSSRSGTNIILTSVFAVISLSCLRATLLLLFISGLSFRMNLRLTRPLEWFFIVLCRVRGFEKHGSRITERCFSWGVRALAGARAEARAAGAPHCKRVPGATLLSGRTTQEAALEALWYITYTAVCWHSLKNAHWGSNRAKSNFGLLSDLLTH